MIGQRKLLYIKITISTHRDRRSDAGDAEVLISLHPYASTRLYQPWRRDWSTEVPEGRKTLVAYQLYAGKASDLGGIFSRDKPRCNMGRIEDVGGLMLRGNCRSYGIVTVTVCHQAIRVGNTSLR